jgi:membrane fusion protein, heavy metal efflux system
MLTKPLSATLFIVLLLLCTDCNKDRPASPSVPDNVSYCQGYLLPTPETLIRIPAPAQGIVRLKLRSPEDFIKAGTVLATLENIEFLQMKQEYLEAENQLEFLQEDYKRQGELTVENATSIKKMQAARRDYQSAELARNALRSRLKAYGICIDCLRPDQLTPFIDIRAPRSGYILEINTLSGSFTSLGDIILVMCMDRSLVLKFHVPEQVIPQLKRDQPVDFYLGRDSLTLYNARLLSRPYSIDPNTHMAEMYAALTGQTGDFIPGMSVTVKIMTSQPVGN